MLAKLLGTLNFKKSLDPPPNGRVVFENCETKKDGLFAPIPMTLLYDQVNIDSTNHRRHRAPTLLLALFRPVFVPKSSNETGIRVKCVA